MKRTFVIAAALFTAVLMILPAAAVGPIVPNPDATASRAIVIDALYQREYKPEEATADFADSSVQWYADAAAWGRTVGIVFGDGDGNFNGDRAVTRAELAAMLYRYAQYKGVDVSEGEDTNILSYDDAFDLPEWSIPAFQWSVTIPIWEEGGMLLPYETLTCSELTHILENFTHGTALPSWTADSEAKKALIDYVVAATDPSEPTFIPVEDRIAVFDLDGTLLRDRSELFRLHPAEVPGPRGSRIRAQGLRFRKRGGRQDQGTERDRRVLLRPGGGPRQGGLHRVRRHDRGRVQRVHSGIQEAGYALL